MVALGGIALNAYLSVLRDRGQITSKTPFPFGHGVRYRFGQGEPEILASYHPSQQNTSTRRLTAVMLRDLFAQAREMIAAERSK